MKGGQPFKSSGLIIIRVGSNIICFSAVNTFFLTLCELYLVRSKALTVNCNSTLYFITCNLEKQYTINMYKNIMYNVH